MGLHVMVGVWMVLFSAVLKLESVQGADCRSGPDTACFISDIFYKGYCSSYPCKIELAENPSCSKNGQRWCLDAMPCCLLGGECKTACAASESRVLVPSDCQAGYSCCLDKKDPTPKPTPRPSGSCGLSLTPSMRIIRGNDVTRKTMPWMVRLMNINTAKTLCSGVLIGSNTVLTAAHCISEYVRQGRLHEMRAGVANTEPSFSSQEILVPLKRAIIAPGFQLRKDKDMAVLKLDNHVTLPAICLPSASHELTGNCRIAGFGSENGVSATLRQGLVKPMKTKRCEQIIEKDLPEDVVCADISKSEIGVHPRDDGGAMECLGKDNRFYLIGVITKYSSDKFPVQVTAVASHLEFIKQYL